MSLGRSIAAIIYLACALGSIAVGFVYLLSDSFIPYHQQALERDWAEFDPAAQMIYLALLDVAGAGWVALGAAIIVLVAFPFRNGDLWARYLIPALIWIFYVPTLATTMKVVTSSTASNPWELLVLCLVGASFALFLDWPWGNREPESEADSLQQLRLFLSRRR